MSLEYDKAWFPRKRSGLGWALHQSWQGWVLMLVTLALAVVGRILIQNTGRYALCFLLLLTIAFALLCWKGERSIWRGEKPDA